MAAQTETSNHTIAIIGGSIAGSEAACLLASHHFKIIVFEMNALPYGKIEDGLPNWHINLRNRQMKSIDSNLNHPNILYVPKVKIGTDISFQDLLNKWKFSAVILANGAWYDRRLPVKEVEYLRNDNLIYQNSFIYWFNHKHERNYQGPQIVLKDKIIVVGGGLASLDVVKAIMIEKLVEKLHKKYNETISPFEIEKKGISFFLESSGETLENLGIEKVQLVYRRGPEHMPLKSPKDDTESEIRKAQEISMKMLSKYQEKYLFELISYAVPTGIDHEDGILKGLICERTKIEGGKLHIIKNSDFLVTCDQIVSSIGSVPEEIGGLPYERGALQMKGKEKYQVEGYTNVFAVGNAVTGRGNIQESKQHGRKMTSKIISEHLSPDALEEWLTNQNETVQEKVKTQVDNILSEVQKQPLPDIEIQNDIVAKVHQIYSEIEFKSYDDWVSQNIPERLEDQLGTI